MVFKKKKRLKKKVVDEDFEDESDEEDDESEESDDNEEEAQEPEESKLPPMPSPKQPVHKLSRIEVEDMIEGHLLRTTELLRLLRSTQ